MSRLKPDPTYSIDTENFKIRNYGDMYYFPQKDLQNGLEEIIIFNENQKKHKIPNGSVFVYDKDTKYNPDIFKSDIGCGMTSYLIERIDFNKKVLQDILKAVDEIGIHIGQGNHFIDFTTKLPFDEYDKILKQGNHVIDFTTGHPSIKEYPNNLVFLHSDFNNENTLPSDYKEAIRMQNDSKEKRIDYLDKLTKKLGISGRLYKDWTHNSVEEEGDEWVYRKGSINVGKTEGIGLLALNPTEGFYLYASKWENYRKSMQHGTGRNPEKNDYHSYIKKVMKTHNKTRGFYNKDVLSNKELKDKIHSAFNSKKEFLDKHMFEQMMIGRIVPEVVVYTKK